MMMTGERRQPGDSYTAARSACVLTVDSSWALTTPIAIVWPRPAISWGQNL